MAIGVGEKLDISWIGAQEAVKVEDTAENFVGTMWQK